MGNSLWRLQTALNYASQNVRRLGRESDVEIIVTDWGSEKPLCDVVELNSSAAALVSFLYVKPDLARKYQKDSPFSEVHALNAAVRRARGQYIGRIDQDTLVGRHFLEMFFNLLDGSQDLGAPLDSTLIFSNHRTLPYRLAARCPPLWIIDRYIEKAGPSLPLNLAPAGKAFFMAPVGIWLLHRRIWLECGGYDERFIYMGYMEIDMVYRLMERYTLVDLQDYADCDFYHLEHYHPFAPRIMQRRINRYGAGSFHPNDDSWGLVRHSLEIVPYHGRPYDQEYVPTGTPASQWLAFSLILFRTRRDILIDRLILASKRRMRFLLRIWAVWRHRTVVALETIDKRSVLSWPRLLQERWQQGKSRQDDAK